MIISRQQLELDHKCVIEKLLIKAPFRLGAVFEDEACFLYMKAGATFVSSPTEKLHVQTRESVLLRCGNYFADLLHQTTSGTCEVYAIHLFPEILREIYKNEAPPLPREGQQVKFAKKIVPSSVVNHFIEGLVFYFENPDLVSPELIKLKLKELMLLLLQSEQAETVAGLLSFLFSPRKATLQGLIGTHLYSNLSVAQLAKLAGMSLSTFKREFQSNFKDSPANYLKKKKIEKAAELLARSGLSVSEICYEVGFNDLSHFTRSFRQAYHCPPSAYREAQKEQ